MADCLSYFFSAFGIDYEGMPELKEDVEAKYLRNKHDMIYFVSEGGKVWACYSDCEMNGLELQLSCSWDKFLTVTWEK